MVDENVPGADRAPYVGRVLERRDGQRRHRPLLEARDVERGVELEEVGERREAGPGVEIVFGQLERVDEALEDVLREVGVVLEAERCAHAASAQTCFYGSQEVALASGALRVEFGVAREADRVAREDVVPVVQPREVQPDDVFEQHEVAPTGGTRQRDEARDHLAWHVNDRELRTR